MKANFRRRRVQRARLPWPIPGVAAPVAAYTLAHALPRVLEVAASPAMRDIAVALSQAHVFIVLAGVTLLTGWIYALRVYLSERRRARLVDRQVNLETLRAIDWRDFERLVGEAFRRWGYRIEETGLGGADGGIDLRLTKAGAVTLVQCKHWKASSVGAPIMREMLGLMHPHRAHVIAVVTSGSFTREARAFAAQEQAIELIDGPKLLRMIEAVQATPQRQEQ